MQGNRIWRSKRSLQLRPRRRMPTFVGGGGGGLGWGRGGPAWRHCAAEKTTLTPTLPQLGPTWGREKSGVLRLMRLPCSTLGEELNDAESKLIGLREGHP